MYSKPNKNVTMIEDLEDLDDLEQRGGHPNMNRQMSGGTPDQYQKFIKPKMGPALSESGMSPYHQPPPPPPEFFHPPPPSQEYRHPNSPTCIEVADHIAGCPICSKFYKNDCSVYIISIVLLAIICILLLKKVLNL